MTRENLRDYLPGAGKRRDQAPPTTVYRSDHCELKACRCGNRGRPDVAIQDANRNVRGYACQWGYMAHITNRELDQFSQWKPTGAELRAAKITPVEKEGLAHIREVVSEFDRYADSWEADDEIP